MTLSQRRSKFVRKPERRRYFRWRTELVRNDRKLHLNAEFGKFGQVHSLVYAFDKMAEATVTAKKSMMFLVDNLAEQELKAKTEAEFQKELLMFGSATRITQGRL